MQRNPTGSVLARRFDRSQAARRFLNGETTAELGLCFGVSKEAVRQALATMGITGKDGGASRRRAANASARRKAQHAKRSAREKFLRSAYGLTLEEYAALRATGPGTERLRAFSALRKTALRQGARWSLTFSQWWAIWTESGVWKQRGAGRFGMTRVRRSMAFRADNVAVVWQPHRYRDGVVPKDAQAHDGKCPLAQRSGVRQPKPGAANRQNIPGA